MKRLLILACLIASIGFAFSTALGYAHAAQAALDTPTDKLVQALRAKP